MNIYYTILNVTDITSFTYKNFEDVNEYDEQQLLDSDSFVEKIMLIEKSRQAEELADNLEKIVLRVKDKNNKKELISIINLTLREKIGNVKANEFISLLREGSGNMLAVIEMIREENRTLVRNGIKQGIKQGVRQGLKQGQTEKSIEIAKKMLNEKMPIELISRLVRFEL